MRITRVDTIDFTPRFKGKGYAMSFGRQTRLEHRLIRLRAENGTTGLGEMVRPPVLPLSGIIALEEAHLPEMEGIAVSDLPALLAKWRGGGKLMQGFVFGVELAMLDLMGKALNVPVSTFLGGVQSGDVREYLSLSAEEPEIMADITRRKGNRFGIIQAKLGEDDPGLDLNRVHAVLAEMRSDQILLADFNGGLSRDDALCALKGFNDPRVIWEEPCNDYEDGAAVARGLSAPVMLDQCLTDLPTCVRAIQDNVAAAMVIKSDSIGGLSVGRTVRDMCVAAGIRVRIDGWWAGPIAGCGALHLAVGVPGDIMMGSIDLTAPIDTPNVLIARPAPGRIRPVAGAGLGLSPDIPFW
ncbi:MAG: mandelate racemase/muconate lactonizing enzyme family protein [Rhodobacteraceae bacterium]|nr:mandelate racemase/muconate lactonizing enzyme family protein [Paracoccaceae bacterium]